MTHGVLYLVRHSETEWNREGRFQGHLDSPLTERGEAQARRMGAALRREIPDHDDYLLTASPLGRTRRTVGIIAEALGRNPSEVRFDDRLKEITWGEWEGHTRAEVDENWPGALDRRRKDRWNFVPPGGESYAMLAARVGDWLAAMEDGARVIAVTHGAAGRMIKGVYAKMDREVAMRLSEPQDAFFRFARGEIEEIPVEPLLDTA